jgi:hypothetical protein
VPEYVPYLSSNLLSIKLPLLVPRGFSANLILLLWCFMGGVCQWGFEGNILALMFKKVYEDPVDTAQDVVDRKLIPVVDWYSPEYIDLLAQSDNSLYQQLAPITVLPKNHDEFWEILKNSVQGNGTHVYLTSGLWDDEKELGRYHFSQELLEGYNGYSGWFINKKYHLSNELAKHFLIYHQVC